jgi:hypothetical protein
MVSEGKSTVMESAGMNKAGMTEAAAKSAVSHAAAAMAAAPATTMATATTTMGRRRNHRTGCDSRRRGKRDHQFAQHDLSSNYCDEHQRLAGAPLAE